MQGLTENTSRMGACESCLRRSHTISDVSQFIQAYRERNPGKDIRDLLRLDTDQLLNLVGNGYEEDLASAFDSHNSVDRIEQKMSETGVWAVCQHDERYPVQLAASGKDAPAVLYGTGEIDRLSWLTQEETIAIVGARRSTGYGLEVASQASYEIAQSGRTVISGMALGIDGAAHRGALQVDGRTVAVLPVSPEQHYPRSHERMHRAIKEHGLVISEMPPGVSRINPTTSEQLHRWHFPARNRIVAAIAGATIVVEASIPSGSMITAGMAKDLGRPLGAVPGPVTSSAQGTNELIRAGATLIRNAQDAIELL